MLDRSFKGKSTGCNWAGAFLCGFKENPGACMTNRQTVSANPEIVIENPQILSANP